MEAVQTRSIFLTASEKEAILTSSDAVLAQFRAALAQRVTARLAAPALADDPAGTDRGRLGWWYPAAEYLSDAAMEHALAPTAALAEWLREETLRTARRPVADWVGPWFRSHSEPFTGHLETAHLCWGVAAVLDLASEVLSEDEQEEVRQALHEKGLMLCQRWLQQNTHLANWRGIMASGAIVAAAALGDEELLDELLPDLARLAQAFQPDGSYGESLQYGNYLANALMLAYEALIRKYPGHAQQLDVAAYGRGMGWVAQSMLYRQPLAGWGPEPRARAVNFNDSAALFRPSGDLLLHVAARYSDTVAAGLARGLFQEYYESCPTQGPHNLASFGFINDWGFLTLPLLARTLPVVLTPEQAGLPLTAAYANGNTFVRDAWGGKSVLAIQGGMNEGCYAPGHLQGDLNSFMLTYGQERLLADPGHSCYRNLIHGLESATQTHNSCTFLVEADQLGLQEDLAKIKLLEQRNVLARRLIQSDGSVGRPVERGGRLRAARRVGDVSLVVSEAAASYGHPIEEFTRLWLQCGPHVTFVLDRIQAAEPVSTVWNWLINNQDDATQIGTAPGQVQATRHGVGLRLWHASAKHSPMPAGPVYSYLHDAYHPEPAQLGEGRPGSGLLFRFTDPAPTRATHRLHVLVADEAKNLAVWQLEAGPDPDSWTVRHGAQEFTLHLPQLTLLRLHLRTAGGHWLVEETDEFDYRLTALDGSRLTI
ncbi:hypothetical protein [Hymenobacter arizonensis]|uniref:Heparinase II/III-like protein n=1 Tax=Hymenobacter arizonensis TaxID=1227077 RepID=A0A1I6BJI5_HYMAR|nr:hypothetical protein [Hymenobacter arizonensis]SFQ81089.1 hypothetical protein SAMN04515668_4619 [Hymenobacter arizonensis]